MGTYTTNYQMYMPSIGEQGWGELVNNNFSTIDTTIKGLSNNIGTLETEINAVEERVTVLEAGNFETVNVVGTITADSINGVILKSNYTITPTSTFIIPVNLSSGTMDVTIFVPVGNITYTGSIVFKHLSGDFSITISYIEDFVYKTISIPVGGTASISFTGIKQLSIRMGRNTSMSAFTIS